MVSKQKILIVDDDSNISNLISLYLEKECFETITVEDGESALEEFKKFSPDLILLDLMLPGIDGYEVCREIRKTYTCRTVNVYSRGYEQRQHRYGTRNFSSCDRSSHRAFLRKVQKRRT